VKAPRLKDLRIAELRRMARAPMTPFEIQNLLERIDLPPRVELAPNEVWSTIVYVNNRYSVQLSLVDTDLGRVAHLWIRHHTGEMPPWRDLQWIKNAIAGPERVAVEVFPPQRDLVDEANMAHLWVYPEDYVMPFGLRR
jgi:hypothetical protein